MKILPKKKVEKEEADLEKELIEKHGEENVIKLGTLREIMGEEFWKQFEDKK